MKRILAVTVVSAAVFAAPTLASERHQSHIARQTVEAVTAPSKPGVVIEPAAQSAPGSEIKMESAFSQPLGAVYGNCNRARKDKTVYLTR